MYEHHDHSFSHREWSAVFGVARKVNSTEGAALLSLHPVHQAFSMKFVIAAEMRNFCAYACENYVLFRMFNKQMGHSPVCSIFRDGI